MTGQNVMQAEAVYKDYAKSLDKSSKSTDKLKKKSKELQKTLAGFDDVEILKDKKDDDEDEVDYAFTPAAISPAIQGLADKIKAYLKGLLDVLKAAWAQEGAKLLQSMRNALEAIKKLLGDIAQTFYDVFTQGYGFDWLVSLFQLLETIFDIITAVATVFDQAWNDDNRGYNYIASIFTMFTAINNMLRDIGQTFIEVWNSGAGYEVAASLLEMFTQINLMIAAAADAFRNAVNMIARTHYSDKQLKNKSRDEVIGMLHEKNDYLSNYESHHLLGSCCIKKKVPLIKTAPTLEQSVFARDKWFIDLEIPAFKKEGREYIEKLI